jgi:hypothetical protein
MASLTRPRPFPEPVDSPRSRNREGAVAEHATITVFGPLAHARGSVGLDGSWSQCVLKTKPTPREPTPRNAGFIRRSTRALVHDANA